MTEQQRPEEDVEGHRRNFFRGPEGTESAESTEEDVEGHGRARLDADAPEDGDDDVEGHGHAARRPL
jgi:hypothetical protein